MSGSFDSRGQLVISDGRIIFCCGKKKSGKSILAKMIATSYPGDLLVVDVAGNDGPMGPDVITVRGTVDTLPTTWPEERRPDDGRRMILRYVPDTGSKTAREDVDHMVGLIRDQANRRYKKGRTGACLLIHEIGIVAPKNRTAPHMMRVLMQNRHDHLTVIAAGPRPKEIDPLVLAQADIVYIFETRNPDDRKRLADAVGWDPKDIDAAVFRLGPHEYLRFDANEEQPAEGQRDMRLVHFPALPDDVVKEVQRA